MKLNTLARLAVACGLMTVPLFMVVPRGQAPSTGAAPRLINQSPDPILASFKFRSIGPASMGGRIDDIAVSDSDPNIIYIGYAVGGVFKSENNATTFEPVFDTYGAASIGDIAIHPRTRTSSTSARANRTTGRPRRSATASTRPPTAGRPSLTSDCVRPNRSRAS
jgi:hypothetical protein